MPPQRPQRLVRHRPLSERIQAMLNPMDLYLWFSEEIQTFDWDSNTFGTRFGLVANFLFLLARANAGTQKDYADDVFGDGPSNGWGSILVHFLVWTLVPISCLNAFYTMTRSRHYRLFEANVETTVPSTPSAHRVRVDSSPATSSPMRIVQGMLSSESAEARAHPDRTRDVWQITVWDPYPATLRIFCLFSPGHLLIHWLFLPLNSLDPRPSVTVFKCLVLQVLFTVQLLLMQTRFTQQAKDTAIIQKEVMNEYDIKYVHPRLHPTVREIGTQVSIGEDGLEQEAVETGTPSTLIRRTFQTHPNPNYARYFDPDGGLQSQPQSRMSSPSPFTPSAGPRAQQQPEPFVTPQVSRANLFRKSLPPQSMRISAGAAPAPPTAAGAVSSSSSTPSLKQQQQQQQQQPLPGYAGGSLGVFSHMNSPLKKATSMGDMSGSFSPRNSREMAALEQRDMAERMVRQSSPLKDSSTINNRRTTTAGTQFDMNQYAHSPNTQTALANARAARWNQERFPTRRVLD
ncbi:hypothetical protein B0T17DRAFT_491175 [Bombardia bombarda]|uniref:Uncharacterized protein n=1 Tax=Bombardia bombarda TaxID=252184 RepID=A0AA40CAN0_9PEZI|nr:hypothetical protein B0T17DRAFT_491175 [Bombardia bombarda]